MKIYNYRNGESAFFEHNEKKVISQSEIEALVKDEFQITMLGEVISRKIQKSKYMVVPFGEILNEYRKGDYKTETREIEHDGEKVYLEIVYDNGDIVLLHTYNEDGSINNICEKKEDWFEDAKKEVGL